MHADELKVELENILYDLVREKMPAWKQMRCLEVISALVAETMIELGVMILTDPPEIHWPHGLITKPNLPPKSRKGKKVQKNKHGIFGELVSKLAPTLPPATVETSAKSTKKSSTVGSKRFKTPVKVNAGTEDQAHDVQPGPIDASEVNDNNAVGTHQGLPVQGRRGSLPKNN